MSDLNQEEEEDDLALNENEIVRVIDLDDGEKDYNDSDENEEDNDEMDTDEAAAAAPTQDDSALTFSGHRDSSVICVRIHPANSEIAVTGGQDDRAFVWSTRDGSVILECTGHTDTVNSVGFSHDGAMVATADMKGLIKVWRVDTCTQVWSFEADEVEWIQWHQAAPVLLAGTRDGQVWMWKIPSGDLKTFVGYGPGATCGKFLPDGKHACVGYEDGAVKIWDLKSNQALHSISGHDGHKDSVYCLDHNSNGTLVLSGAGDMTAKVTNIATGKVVSTLTCQQSTDEDSVESVAFSKTHDYAVTGTLGGSLEIWDLPSKSVRHKCEHPHGIVKILCPPTGATFYTSCLDGNIRQYDSRNGQLLNTWQGHTAGILDFDISSDGSILVTASDDSSSKVFSLAPHPT
ncbi:hypothetical protein RRG08_020955 [Elysia crispata]|uniref:Angio-associated migratory cell protein n=1 Tax=Elysia crispata TaxID=231223 RepID=A0AAE1CWL8_9GAST|nr:hypothetical protein RRG08_020955 [Elysia crispata]